MIQAAKSGAGYGKTKFMNLSRWAFSDDWSREIAIQLMGECGLRASEVPYPSDENLRWSEAGDCWLLEVRGKNTKGGEKTIRDAWIPESAVDSIHRYVRERGFDTDDNWVDVGSIESQDCDGLGAENGHFCVDGVG